MLGSFRDSGMNSLKRTTLHKSEGVQEDNKTSSVPSTGTSPEHAHVPGSHKTWGSQLKRYPR
ncbi:hypothetical protein Taro_036912 [Colocasia esculenta]|uniref:Uncharacterized protein n=1 Tax=Colocasia esculenta TaxID=4460 RepID=A0A843WN42_COLES|nr:hypothetical protein [Colocasia esculenta]